MFRHHRSSLANGLRVVTIELPHLHRATVVLYARIGSRFEDRASNGLSHLTEHMLFRGTRRRPSAFALNDAIERLGGTLYAETGIEYSLFSLSVHPESVGSAIALLGEVFSEPRFSDLDVEKRIVREEILEDLDERGRDINVDNVSRRTMFPDHPLGYKITGSLRNVDRFRRADVREHFSRWYQAGNLVLCVSGAARHERVLRHARDAFAGLERGERAATTPPGNGQREPRLAYVRMNGSQTNLQLLFRAFSEQDRDWPAAAAVTRLLDDGLSTRLHHRICDQLGLAYYVGAGLEAFTDTSLFEIDAQVAHANVPRMLRELFSLLAELRDHRVRARELDKVKRRYRWDLLASLDDPDAMAGWLGGGELTGHRHSLDERLARMDAVTPADVGRAAARLFDPRNLTLGAVGNLGGGLLARTEKLLHALD